MKNSMIYALTTTTVPTKIHIVIKYILAIRYCLDRSANAAFVSVRTLESQRQLVLGLSQTIF
jgi:hypothetical protein